MEHSEAAIEAAKGSTWDLDYYAESADWEGVGIAYSHHRDSDSVYESNWQVICEDFSKRFGFNDLLMGDIHVALFTHWAVGWVEHLTYNTARKDIEAAVNEIHEKLIQYPLLDEMHHSELVWNKCHPTEGYLAGKCACSPDESCGCEGNNSECFCTLESAWK
jgi:hypothetical protein